MAVIRVSFVSYNSDYKWHCTGVFCLYLEYHVYSIYAQRRDRLFFFGVYTIYVQESNSMRTLLSLQSYNMIYVYTHHTNHTHHTHHVQVYIL